LPGSRVHDGPHRPGTLGHSPTPVKYGHHVDRDARHQGETQYLRRRHLALSRNALFQAAYAGEDYVLWIDADLVAYPADVLRQLLAAGKEILVPHGVLDPGER